MTPTPEAVAALTLLALPGMSPARLRRCCDAFGGPVGALAAVRDGRAATALRPADRAHGVATSWARSADPARAVELLERRRTRVLLDGADDYPFDEQFPDRPAVLLAEGDDPGVLARPRVAVVGTRAATPAGRDDARGLGRFLADAGVTVVSGLAIGIDAAAHEGALERGGGVVGVVATGLDVVYPRRHHGLHAAVRRGGLLVGEQPYGTGPLPRRFPVRNRIIAAIATVVVVVEATLRGGARITAEHALRYGRPVLAMPGSRRNPAAEGCNRLVADGAHPLLEPDDVLVALGLAGAERIGWSPPRPAPSADGARVLAALAGDALTADAVADRTGFDPGRIAVAVADLERAGALERRRGLLWPR